MLNLCAIRRRLNDFSLLHLTRQCFNAVKHLLIGRLFKLNLPFFYFVAVCPVIQENGYAAMVWYQNCVIEIPAQGIAKKSVIYSLICI